MMRYINEACNNFFRVKLIIGLMVGISPSLHADTWFLPEQNSEDVSSKQSLTNLRLRFFETPLASGLDESTTPNWLIVPLNGSNRCDVMSTGVAQEVNLSKLTWIFDRQAISIVVAKIPNSTIYTITVTGKQVGETTITAKTGNTIVGSLKVTVKERQRIDVNLIYCSDDSQYSTTRTSSQAQAIINSINAIWSPQANIGFRVKGTYEAKLKGIFGEAVDYGNPINIQDKFHEIKANHQIQGGVTYVEADLNLFLVWQTTSNAAGVAETPGKYSVVGDLGDASTFAHEFGHNLNLPHLPNKTKDQVTSADFQSYGDNLMYPSGDDYNGGIDLRKVQVDRVHNHLGQ